MLTCSQVSQSLFGQLYYSMWILARASCGNLKLFLQKHGDCANRMDQVSMRQVWADVDESRQHREQSHHSIQLVKPDRACCMSKRSQDSLSLSHISYLPHPQTNQKCCSAGWSKSKQAPMQIKLMLPLLLSCHAAAVEQSQCVCVRCCFRKHVADDNMCTQVTMARFRHRCRQSLMLSRTSSEPAALAQLHLLEALTRNYAHTKRQGHAAAAAGATRSQQLHIQLSSEVVSGV